MKKINLNFETLNFERESVVLDRLRKKFIIGDFFVGRAKGGEKGDGSQSQDFARRQEKTFGKEKGGGAE